MWLAIRITKSIRTSLTSLRPLCASSNNSRLSTYLLRKHGLSVLSCSVCLADPRGTNLSAGILPSNTTTYTLAQLEGAMLAQTSVIPYFGCFGNGTILDEVWHFSHVLGTEQMGRFKPINSTTPSTCAATGIRYLERTPTSERDVRALP